MSSVDPNNPCDLELIVGTYEDYVVGYQIETPTPASSEDPSSARKKLKNGNDDSSVIKPEESLCLEQSFAVRGHSGSVRCLAGSSDGRLVFSAGYDEMMNLFNLKRRKLLQTSEGAINCATFVQSSHLICGSEDGNVYIYECKASSMTLAKTLKGHKASVVSLDAHPSGKILLSIAKDQTMKTWNLIKGRSAYTTHIKPEAHLVKWSKIGEEFLIAANNEIYLYNNLGNLKQCIKLNKRVNSIEFITDSIFAVAIDSGRVEFFHLGVGQDDECKLVLKLEAHETRVKSLKCLTEQPLKKCDGKKCESNGATSKTTTTTTTTTNSTTPYIVRFATVSSDGVIKIWSVINQRDTLKDPQELVRLEVGARLTCMMVSTRKSSG